MTTVYAYIKVVPISAKLRINFLVYHETRNKLSTNSDESTSYR